MVPSIRDIVGAPVPGLRAGQVIVRPSAEPFGRVLQKIERPAAATAATRPGAPARAVTAPEPGEASTGGARLRPAQEALAAAIRRSAASAGVAPALSIGVARAESSLDPAAVSPDGKSVGTFQVTHTTAAEMRRKFARGTVARPAGSDDVALGVGYLRYLHDLFARSAKLGRGLSNVAVADAEERQLFAVAAFNAGEGRVAQAQQRAAAGGGDPARFADVRRYLPPITQTYVGRVAGYAREDAAASTVA